MASMLERMREMKARKEAESDSVALRRHGQGDLGAKKLDDLIAELTEEIAERR